MFRFFYTLVLHLYALCMLPKMWKKKYRSNFLQRLGIGFPKIEKTGPLIWIHAVSLGETKAVAPLAWKLKGGAQILLSTTTATGHAEGKKNIPADWHVYLPFDLPYLIRPIVKRVSPDLVILTETDFWYHFQSVAPKVIVVNGKLSARTFARYKKMPIIAKYLLHPIDHFCVQGELYKERFMQLGIPEEKLTVTGNLKLDGHKEQPIERTDNHFVLTLGSTHDPEEKIWIPLLQKLPVKTYLVPRHPERFDEVAKMLQKAGINYGRYSEDASFETCSVILVDAMGVLKKCYQRSDLAFVGGSLTAKVGGHNILEPAFYGVPVLYGPHMQTQPDLVDLMKRYQAGQQVNPEDLLETVSELIDNSKKRFAMGEQGKKLILESAGALDKTYGCIKSRGCSRVSTLSRDGAVVSSLGS